MNKDLLSTNRFKREVFRKALHLPAFVFPLLALHSRLLAVDVLFALMLFYSVFMFVEMKFPGLQNGISQIVTFFKRNEALDPAPLYLALSMLLCLLFSTPKSVFFAAYVIAICDSAAALVGIRFGKHQISNLNKSWEGTLAFMVFCFLGGLFYLPPLFAFLTALLLAFVELIGIRGLDNLLLPIASQLCLWLFLK